MGSTEEIRGVVMIDLSSYTKGGDKDGAKTEDYQTQVTTRTRRQTNDDVQMIRL